MSTGNIDAVRGAQRKAKSVGLQVPRVQLEDTRIEWVNAKYSILVPEPAALLVTIGHRLRSQQSGASHNWRASYGRSQQLRKAVMHALARIDLESVLRALGGPPNTLRFVRMAPRSLDTDNLAAAFKPVRDQVCCWLGGDNTLTARANDGARSGYAFDYGQQQQRSYGLRIEIRRVT